MECIYISALDKLSDKLDVTGDEARHLKVLHINTGDMILAVNGSGLSAKCEVERMAKEHFTIRPIHFEENRGELPIRLGLAPACLHNRDRFELIIEKSVELGVAEIFPLFSEFVQRRKVSVDRLALKAVAAMKQSKRSVLPSIHNPVNMKDLTRVAANYETIVLADENGSTPDLRDIKKSVLVLIGPEGGFSEKETGILKEDKRCIAWNLGNRRLRAETAAIVTLGIISAGIFNMTK